ncbi:ParB-like partition protein [Rhodococcus phage Finch]|uniref:ParB-like nuclease domain protein n=1 Tax=Rhodococcus phage Finch TaxID=2094144 RepID=A0A2P1JXP2_9CAUD|nr:ParB-like partition protein [Rhodococcus phage Finch]AVO25131.1 ParB-like nuclease domain protein [Rhodococcus phage Finch]
MAEHLVENHHPSELALFHLNPRVGNVDAIAGSLRANGQYKPVLVNKGSHTGRPNEVLAGNHTVMAIRDLAEQYPDEDRWQSVACWIVDVDDDRATRIVAADNRTSELGSFDDRLLLELLAELDELDGTGYEPNDLQALEDLLGGAPSLEDLEKEVGEPTEADSYTIVRLAVDPVIGKQWDEHRKGFDNDTDALEALLDGAEEE